MHIEHAKRAATAIPADAPEYVKKRIELRRAGKRRRTVKAKPVQSRLTRKAKPPQPMSSYEAQSAVLKARLEL